MTKLAPGTVINCFFENQFLEGKRWIWNDDDSTPRATSYGGCTHGYLTVIDSKMHKGAAVIIIKTAELGDVCCRLNVLDLILTANDINK